MESAGQGYVVHEGCDHIFFVGFLGAGKSTLARNLSGLFHRPCVDTDRLVERALGKSIACVFSEDGEDAFRDEETRVLKGPRPGSPARELRRRYRRASRENAGLMRQMGTVVFLDGDL